ncbi:MAG TPA: hypothetical protein VGA96_01925, partial [Fibrella sp.]
MKKLYVSKKLRACLRTDGSAVRIALTAAFFLLYTVYSFAQNTPQVIANFGQEGDVNANYRIPTSGTFNAAGTDDWFYRAAYPGTGRGIIDTTGTAALRAFYQNTANNRNITFTKRMATPNYTVVNNRLWLDGLYIRDNNKTDSSAFLTSNKNGDNPATSWTAGVSQVTPKNDIIDAYVHARRDGSTVTSPFWLFGGVATDNIQGSRYFDFELYQTRLTRVGSSFTNAGPQEGHTAWTFNANGTLAKSGDLIVAVSFDNTGILTFEVRIWVARTVGEGAVQPANFNFSGPVEGGGTNSTYGYVTVLPKTAGTSFYSGAVNPLAAPTDAAPWGYFGQNSTFTDQYLETQFLEFSLNLSALGIDPATSTAAGIDPCSAAFQKFFAKTRASASFTSSLIDFVGPADFIGIPATTTEFGPPTLAVCANQFPYTLTAQTVTTAESTVLLYNTFSTNGGTITGVSGNQITVSTPGTYVTQGRLYPGCNV